jgi:hypothetical protein
MTLVRIVADLESLNSVLTLETTPAAATPGEKVQLRFMLSHPGTGARIKEFNIVHGMPFHLFIVSHGLEYYEHIHPAQQPDGTFTIETVLPEPGHYELFCDFFPVGGAPQVVHRTLSTADSRGDDRRFVRSSLESDGSLTKSVDGTRFELTLEPTQPVAGRPTLLRYYLVNDETGQPVTDLQPYLGAWGHTVALREDATDFFHSHAATPNPAGRLGGGPRVTFGTFFAQPGQHRIWSQFQRKGRVVTVSFTVSVWRLDRLAKWDGNGWSSLTGDPVSDLNGAARALAASGEDVYLGGDFTVVDGVRASRIARWDGHKWSALGRGVNGRVWAIAVRGKEVYVGGDFTAAGGKRARGVAKWDGRNWFALGSGISGCKNAFEAPTVYALAVSGRAIYAGGQFSRAGGVTVNGIAKWNGHAWRALGDGVRTGSYDGVVRALALRGNDLYAGGQFLTAGGVGAYNIARWNGRRWSALGSGIRGNLEKVLAIGVSGTDVYVGGMFTSAGGVSAPNIARWDGSGWSAADVRTDDGVWTISVSGPDVYAGGASFTLPSGEVAKGIVKWDGGNWSGLGGGIGDGMYSGPIMAIAPTGGNLYVGGDAFGFPGAPNLTPKQAARGDWRR